MASSQASKDLSLAGRVSVDLSVWLHSGDPGNNGTANRIVTGGILAPAISSGTGAAGGWIAQASTRLAGGRRVQTRNNVVMSPAGGLTAAGGNASWYSVGVGNARHWWDQIVNADGNPEAIALPNGATVSVSAGTIGFETRDV